MGRTPAARTEGGSGFHFQDVRQLAGDGQAPCVREKRAIFSLIGHETHNSEKALVQGSKQPALLTLQRLQTCWKPRSRKGGRLPCRESKETKLGCRNPQEWTPLSPGREGTQG